jgi:hypothetical protein
MKSLFAISPVDHGPHGTLRVHDHLGRRVPHMAGQKTENSPVSGTVGKDLVNKDGKVTELIAWATQNISSPEEMLDYFQENNLITHSEATGDYIVVHGPEKAEWCAKHEGSLLFCVQWHFYQNRDPKKDAEGKVVLDDAGNAVFGEFAAIHLISRAGKFIINDSAQIGMYGQLRKETDIREEKNPDSAVFRTSTAGLMVPGGLRRNNTSYYDTRTNKTIRRADLDDVVKHPLAFRAESTPTWKFDL